MNADGSVRMFVSDEVADLFEDAERDGVSADELMTRFLEQAEAQVAVPVNANTSRPDIPLPDGQWAYS